MSVSGTLACAGPFDNQCGARFLVRIRLHGDPVIPYKPTVPTPADARHLLAVLAPGEAWRHILNLEKAGKTKGPDSHATCPALQVRIVSDACVRTSEFRCPRRTHAR